MECVQQDISEKNVAIGKRIKYLRKSILNINQTDFGKALGLAQTTIAGYEKGQRSLSPAAIMSICREYGVSEHWLRTGVGEPLVKKSAEAMDGPVSKSIETLSSVYGLDAADISVLLKYMELEKDKREVIKNFLNI